MLSTCDAWPIVVPRDSWWPLRPVACPVFSGLRIVFLRAQGSCQGLTKRQTQLTAPRFHSIPGVLRSRQHDVGYYSAS